MKIAIYARQLAPANFSFLEQFIGTLEERQHQVIIYQALMNQLKSSGKPLPQCKIFSSGSEIHGCVDLLCSIGGDGTILRAAAFVRNSGVPLLGINAGRLGFLAKVQKENIDILLQYVISQNYTTSERTLLGITCEPYNEAFKELNFAMNEVTVSRKDTTSMITVETYLNNEYLNSYWADGLIISTPTGSTGYSLSCGGPILTPDVKSLVITPIAPHNLTARPLVIPDDTEITLRVTGREDQYLVSLDSRISSVKNESILKIKKTDYKIKMVEIPGETFLKTLRNKLLWGEDKRN